MRTLSALFFPHYLGLALGIAEVVLRILGNQITAAQQRTLQLQRGLPLALVELGPLQRLCRLRRQGKNERTLVVIEQLPVLEAEPQ